MVSPTVDIHLSGSAGGTWAVPGERCHAACMKGDHYPPEFPRGVVQFRTIILSLGVINILEVFYNLQSDILASLSVEYHRGHDPAGRKAPLLVRCHRSFPC